MAGLLKTVIFTFLGIAICGCHAFSRPRFHSAFNSKIHSPLPSQYSYTTMYMKQKIDHFGFNEDNFFNQRYLLANQFWNNDNGPIFFYTGNEGDIAWFCNNTGFMWEIAPEFKALLIFAEHRYYGETLPFGDESYTNASTLNYLTSEQALADFAELIRYVKQTVPGAANSPVIAFGGSYGGMLATWMRLKYPNLVQGTLAGSAPIWQFQDLTPCDSFYNIVEKTFLTGSRQCVDNIQVSWVAITDCYPEDLDFLSKAFGLCTPLGNKYDLSDLMSWLVGVYTDLAIVDYPYKASFLEPLPAWPVKEFCKYLSKPLNGKDLIMAIAQGVNMYFNYTGQTPCLNISQQATSYLGDKGWDFQACTEMVMPMCSNGSNMFYNIPWNYNSYALECKQRWGVMPRENWISLSYWGKNITTASNIIFSNGLLDPWSSGGVLQSLSPSLIAIQIPSGAHHLDLRASNPGDPTDVKAARQQEKNIIKNWLYGSGQ